MFIYLAHWSTHAKGIFFSKLFTFEHDCIRTCHSPRASGYLSSFKQINNHQWHACLQSLNPIEPNMAFDTDVIKGIFLNKSIV